MTMVPTGAKWEATAALDEWVVAPVLVEEAPCEAFAVLPPVVPAAEAPEAEVEVEVPEADLRAYSLSKEFGPHRTIRLTRKRQLSP
jgi:hypothetical protein